MVLTEELVKEKKQLIDLKRPAIQNLLIVGFKGVTREQLYDRFACGQITKRLKNQREKEIEEKYGPKFSSFFGVKKCRWPHHFDLLSEFPSKTCTVKMGALNGYADGIIPDRCYKTLSLAKECGAKNFQVARPVIEDIATLDPVIVARFPEAIDQGHQAFRYIEIDMWE